MSGLIHTGAAVFMNADKTAVVDVSSPTAAFMLVGSNGEVPREFEALYCEHFGVEASAHTEKPRTVTYGNPGTDDPAAEPAAEPTEEPPPTPAAAKKPRRRTPKK